MAPVWFSPPEDLQAKPNTDPAALPSEGPGRIFDVTDSDSNDNLSEDERLLKASRENDPVAVLELIEKGAAIDARTPNTGEAPLHLVAERGGAQLVSVLVRSGARINARDNQSLTPLHAAAMRGNAAAVQALLEGKADVDSIGGLDGYSPLHCAAMNSHLPALSLLLNASADTSLHDNSAETALHKAAERGLLSIAERLLEGGAALRRLVRQHRDGCSAAWARRARQRP